MSSMSRLRGLRALLEDAVEHGTTAVERVHKATAARPFEVLDLIPAIAPAARGVRLVHDATVAGVYETIRQVNHVVGLTLSAAIDLYETKDDQAVGEPEDTQGSQTAPTPALASECEPGRVSETASGSASASGERRG
jgi:hypothetical protein